MPRTVSATKSEATERAALRRRVKQFYRRFNEADWDGCFALVDPELTRRRKVNLNAYSERMREFKNAYGDVRLRWIDLSLHLHGAPRQGDARPFAYAYLLWQDDTHQFHLFRERWVKDEGKWFTRVAGLVPDRSAGG
ncbi:MAG: hypothetical protein WD066_00170 [Planctomycetaceae bacterium]